MTEKKQIHIIPASPGWRCVHRDARELFVGDAVIAWRIETECIRDKLVSYAYPIFANEEADPDGFLLPDGRVESFDGNYPSLDEAQKAYIAHLEQRRATIAQGAKA